MLDKRKEQLRVGQPVIFWDSLRRKCHGLIQAVHGQVQEYDGKISVPCINILFTSQDSKCVDQYGRQAEHATSVSWGGGERFVPVGFYFCFPDENIEPQEQNVGMQR